MKKIILLCALVCVVTVNIGRTEDITEYNLPDPFILINSNGLFTLWKTNTSVHFNSTNEKFKPCTITIDPIQDFTLMRIQAKELNDGKFILWAYRNFNYNYNRTISLYHTALIIDPLSCSYKAVLIPEEKKPLKNWPLLYSRVVNLVDGFDFFYPSHGKCSPCRFSLQGEPVPLEYQLEPEEEVFIPYGFDIISVDGSDSNKGFIYTLNLKNNTSLIKYLDGNFKVMKQVLLGHPVHSLSVNYNKQPVISICYASHNFVDDVRNHNFKVHCEQFDSDLSTELTVRLPVPDDQFVFELTGIAHRVDQSGNMFIGLMQYSDKITDKYLQLRVLVVDKSGNIVENRDYEKTKMQNTHKWFELHSHLSLDKKFCVVSDTRADLAAMDTREVVTCLYVSKFSN